MSKIPTPKELQEFVKRLTPKQLKLIQARIPDVFAKYKRSQFKLIRGGRRSTKHDKAHPRA